MVDHDSLQVREGKVFANSQLNSEEIIKKVSPEFAELSLDIQEIFAHSKDPAFVSALLFRLVKEREQSNKLLAEISDKFDRIMLEIKTRQVSAPAGPAEMTAELGEKNRFTVLPEQDQMILNLVEERGSIDAKGVKESLGYKGLNAASQRLNKLFREGYLKKIQSGKKVLYLAK